MDDVLGRVESRLGCGNSSSRVIAAAMAPKRRSSVQRVQEQHRLEFFENAVTTTTVAMAGVDAIGHGGSVGGMGQNPRTSTSGEAPSDGDGTERLVVCGGTEGGPSRTIEAVPGDQVRPPPVPLSVLKRAEENRAVLVRMCELRRLSHEPRASKERLRRILTDYLINHENGLAAHAQHYYSFLAGRVAKQPHLLNFQMPCFHLLVLGPINVLLTALARLQPQDSPLPRPQRVPSCPLMTRLRSWSWYAVMISPLRFQRFGRPSCISTKKSCIPVELKAFRQRWTTS